MTLKQNIKLYTCFLFPERQETRTECEERRAQSMIIMVVYEGQWSPKCDSAGLFLPQQCDNTGTSVSKVSYVNSDLSHENQQYFVRTVSKELVIQS
mgnify:CR=1 FL=1